MGVVDVRHHAFLTSVLDEVSGQLHYTAVYSQGKEAPLH